MSELHDDLKQLVADRKSSNADPVRNLRTGESFTAEIEPVEPIIAQTELGEDAREVVILHISNFTEAAAQRLQDLVEFTLHGRLVAYRLVKRRDNAANPMVDFWAMQKADVDS